METDTIALHDSRTEPRPGARSCTTCAKAKAKCVRQLNQRTCERCARLKKDCYMKEPVLRKRKTIKTTRAAQLENLEHKIEHLVNALATSTTQAHPTPPSRGISEYGVQPSRGISEYGGQPSPPISQVSQSDPGTNRSTEILQRLCHMSNDEPSPCSVGPSPGMPSVEPLTSQIPDYQNLGVSMAEAEVLLDRYMRLMAPGLPFVVFEPGMSAQQLYSQKPLLLHAIVTVTYFHDLPKQQTLVKGLMRDISERILINSEKSVGVVQGLLVIVAWYHPHIFWGQQITNLLHLAIGMIIDLGFDRSPMACAGGEWKSETTKAVEGTSNSGRAPSLDEHRALAGTFYLSSIMSTSFKRLVVMPYTKYLDNCLTSLEEAREYPSDLYLVQLIRVQNIIGEANAVETPKAPIQMYVKAFGGDLVNLKERDSCAGRENIFLQLQYLTAEIQIWELSLNDLQENKGAPLRSHLDGLYHCVKAIRAFLDVYFSIPLYMYLTLPFSVFNQFAHAFITLTKIASLEIEGWDFKTMEHEIDFGKTIDEAASRFEQAAKVTPDGLITKNESFGKWAQRVRWMKQIYEAKFQPDPSKTAVAASSTQMQPQEEVRMPHEQFSQAAITPGAQQPTPPDDVLSGDFFNYLDENFWQSFGGQLDLGWPEMNMA